MTLRTALALALLATSWLWGLHYYEPARALPWVAAWVAATLLLAGSMDLFPHRRPAAVMAVLLVPVAWWMPWPFKVMVVLLLGGMMLALLPLARRWPRRLAGGALAAGAVLFVQAVVLEIYAAGTSYNHDLPAAAGHGLAGLVGLLGVESVYNGTDVAVRSLGQVYRFAPTWGLLLDPVSLVFFVGALAALGLECLRLPSGARRAAWFAAAGRLAMVLLVWMPLRAALLLGLYLNRMAGADEVALMSGGNQFVSVWVHFLCLGGLAVLTVWWVPSMDRLGGPVPAPARSIPIRTAPDRRRTPRASAAAMGVTAEGAGWTRRLPWQPALVPSALLVGLAAAVLTTSYYWDPVGRRKEGRVMVVERHSEWEPTTRPYDTTWYGEDSGYNYAAIYDYSSHYYTASQLLEDDVIHESRLAECDVLIIKTPTARYSPREVEAVVRFVENGGGLLLIGDHNNVMDMGTYLNDVVRNFGFAFRHDALYCVGSAYLQPYSPPLVPHPAIRHLPPMNYAVANSIEPGRSWGRTVMRGTGLWNLPPGYHLSNYFPEAAYLPEMRYGAFVQTWAARYGRGRVVAFTDSTIFSNFCTFQPGKAELWMGMVEWLNHGDRLGDPRRLLFVLGLIPLAAGVALVPVSGRRQRDGWLLAATAGLLGWTLAGMAIYQASAWAIPEPEQQRPMTRIVVDRTVSQAPLLEGAFSEVPDGSGYGVMEAWIGRLGYFPTRREGREAFSGDALVIITPTLSVSDEYLDGLLDYVEGGGRVLVIDAPGNRGTTANSLLWPFGMAIRHRAVREGELTLDEGWPDLGTASSGEVVGGDPLAHVADVPAAARIDYGRGAVLAVGFGALFTDESFGGAWSASPDEATLLRYEVFYALMRHLVEDAPIVPVRPEIESAAE